MTKGKQWAAMDLPIDDVRRHQSFQYRVDGIDAANLKRIRRVLAAGGETRDPIRVARIGKALYLLDGFHRLEAYRLERRHTIPALVAKMSLEEAREEARRSNAANGKPYSPKDKVALWEAFVAEGRHLDERTESPKASRVIADELGGFWSHETIRKKLKELGHELDEDVEFDGEYKPLGPTEEQMAEERLEEAEDAIGTLGSVLPTLDAYDRARLLQQARAILDAVEDDDGPGREKALAELRVPMDL
jgi:hypothetical protein